MRFLASALVVFSGSLLWGAGALGVTWGTIGKGNTGTAELASYGGMLVVVAGFVLLVHAFNSPEDRR